MTTQHTDDDEVIEKLYTELHELVRSALEQEIAVPMSMYTIYRDGRQPECALVPIDIANSEAGRDAVASKHMSVGSDPQVIVSCLVMNVWVTTHDKNKNLDEAVADAHSGKVPKVEGYVFNFVTPIRQGMALCHVVEEKLAEEKADIQWIGEGDFRPMGRFVREDNDNVQGHG